MLSLENGRRIKAKISLRSTTQIERRVATWRIMLTKSESSMPKRFDRSTKCPLDEIGKNSHKPCTSPKTISTSISKLHP